MSAIQTMDLEAVNMFVLMKLDHISVLAIVDMF